MDFWETWKIGADEVLQCKNPTLKNVYGCFTVTYVCAPCACLVKRGQKRALDPMEVELEMVVGCHVVPGN